MKPEDTMLCPAFGVFRDRVLAYGQAAPLRAALILVSLLCCGLIAWVDKPLALHIKTHISDHTLGFFKTITDWGKGGPWFTFAGVGFVCCAALARWADAPAMVAKYRHFCRSFWFMIVAMAASGIVVNIIKPIIGRLRPRYLFENGEYGIVLFNTHTGMNSFPSGHSQAIWSAMVCLWILFPRYNYVYGIVALMIAASRVMTTVHYVSDTFMGTFIGIAITLILKEKFEKEGRSLTILPYKS
jgi:membrane-associated phospholipid phosphatase